jgi:hypothetical protein
VFAGFFVFRPVSCLYPKKTRTGKNVYNNVYIIFAKDEVCLEVKRLLRFHKYPPDDQPRAVETVIEQAEIFAEALV